MSLSLTDMSEKLQGGDHYEMNDSFAGKHNEKSAMVEVPSSEKTNSVTEKSKHAENMLSSNQTIEESEKMVTAEVSVEEKLDSGYSWVIVCASFINCFVVGVMFIGFSILYVEIGEYFGSSKGVTGWIGSLYMASGNVFGILFSVLIGRYGCRIVALIGGFVWFVGFALSSLAPHIIVLYFTYGIVAGMGFNMVTLTSFVIVQQHFKKLRPLAAAISACGISVGSLCSGPLLTAMLNAFQWHGTILLMSGMVLNCCVFGALYRPPLSAQKNHQKSSGSDATDMTLRETLQHLLRDLSDLSIFSNVPFTLVCFGSFLMNLGLMVFMQHTPSRAVAIGIEHRLAYLLPSIAGITLLAGRISGGVIGNLSCTNRLLQYGVNIIVGGLLLIVIGTLFSFDELAVFGAAIGLVTGFFLTIQTTVLSDLVGVKNVARAQAFLLLFIGLGALISVPLAGFVYDTTNDYSIPFYMGGAVEVLGGIFVIVAAALKHFSQ